MNIEIARSRENTYSLINVSHNPCATIILTNTYNHLEDVFKKEQFATNSLTYEIKSLIPRCRTIEQMIEFAINTLQNMNFGIIDLETHRLLKDLIGFSISLHNIEPLYRLNKTPRRLTNTEISSLARASVLVLGNDCTLDEQVINELNNVTIHRVERCNHWNRLRQ